MLRAATSVLLTLFASGATAQDNDPSKWRAFVPYVRALTDCVARSIRANPSALETAAQGQWDAALTVAGCPTEMAQMVAAHDQIYGWNTGKTFLLGPYKQDLPRALSERLRPDFDARSERRRQQEEAKRREELAEREAKEAGRKLLTEAKAAHDACLRAQAIDLVPYSSELADTLVTVIMTRCADHERRREDLAVVALGMTKQEAHDVMGQVMAETRKEWLTAIVTIRAEAEKSRQEQRQEPPSRGGTPAAGGQSY